MARELTGEEKLNSVEGQMRDILKGRVWILRCPYCKTDGERSKTRFGDTFCCETMLAAVTAVMQRLEIEATNEAVYKASKN